MNDHEGAAGQPKNTAGTKNGPADQQNGHGDEAGAAQDAQAELAAARDKLLRVQAEFDNYQKRVMRERADERRYASLPLLRDLLPVRDNLQRALEAADKSEQADNASGLLEGVRLVAQQFATVFDQYGCKEIAAQGAEFDPHLHDALTMQPSNDQPSGRVLTVFRPGYQLHDRVVRPAQVVVSSGPAGDSPQKGGAAG